MESLNYSLQKDIQVWTWILDRYYYKWWIWCSAFMSFYQYLSLAISRKWWIWCLQRLKEKASDELLAIRWSKSFGSWHISEKIYLYRSGISSCLQSNSYIFFSTMSYCLPLKTWLEELFIRESLHIGFVILPNVFMLGFLIGDLLPHLPVQCVFCQVFLIDLVFLFFYFAIYCLVFCFPACLSKLCPLTSEWKLSMSMKS